MTDFSDRTLATLAVSRACDELLCRAVIREVENGATEEQWLQVMRDTRALLASKFFEMVADFEGRVADDPAVQDLRALEALLK